MVNPFGRQRPNENFNNFHRSFRRASTFPVRFPPHPTTRPSTATTPFFRCLLQANCMLNGSGRWWGVTVEVALRIGGFLGIWGRGWMVLAKVFVALFATRPDENPPRDTWDIIAGRWWGKGIGVHNFDGPNCPYQHDRRVMTLIVVVKLEVLISPESPPSNIRQI